MQRKQWKAKTTSKSPCDLEGTNGCNWGGAISMGLIISPLSKVQSSNLFHHSTIVVLQLLDIHDISNVDFLMIPCIILCFMPGVDLMVRVVGLGS